MNADINVWVTGADRGLGLALCEVFLQKGCRVFAGRYLQDWNELDVLADRFPEGLHVVTLDVSSMDSVNNAVQFTENITDRLDVLVNNAGIAGQTGKLGEEMNFDRAMAMFNVNSLGPLRMTERFLPLMQNGMKRLCYISSEAGSVSVCSRTDSFAYTMTKTALNMGIRHMHNQLGKQGYTFRVYHPGWLRSYMSGQKNMQATVEPMDSAHAAVEQFMSENRHETCLQMLDNTGAVWPF